METNNVELITRMVLDALNKKEEKGNGFMVPIGVSARQLTFIYGEYPFYNR